MQIQTDRALIPALADAVRYLTIKLTAPQRRARESGNTGAPNDRAGINVSLVLDRSGSMAGSKMKMARKAVEHAIRLLDARDHLAVVSYDNEVDVVLGRVAASPEAKALALKRLSKIDARGATNLDAGWAKGLELAADAGTAKADSVSRVLLMSDGLANEGVSDPTALAARAAEFRARGIATSTFGVGADFDERLMSRLATEGGGHFYYIEDPRQIPDILASELGETLEIVARDACLEIACGDGVSVEPLNEFKTEAHDSCLRLRLGDLVSGQEQTIVLAVRCRGRATGEVARIECRTVDRDQALFPGAMTIDWTAAAADAHDAQPVNMDVVIAAAELVAERIRAAALELNRAGRFDEAKALLKRGAAEIFAMAPGDARLRAMAAALESEVEDYGEAMSALEMKNVYFQSANLMSGRTREGKARRTASS